MFFDFLKFAFSNLRHRKVRSWLTILGIFIGIAAVVSLISLGQGMQKGIEEQFERLGADKMIIMPGVFAPPGSVTTKSLILTEDDLEFVKDIRGVETAVGYVAKLGKIMFKDEVYMSYIAGISVEDVEFWQEDFKFLEIEDGRVFEEREKFKVVVGSRYADGDIFDKNVKVRDTIEIEEQEFKVVGIMKKTGDPSDDASVYIPKETLRELLDVPKEESIIMVKIAEGFDPEELADTIERKLRKFRGEKEDEETFIIQTFEQLLETFGNIFGVVQAVLVGIAAISLVVGGIGIMNTMYTSVLERTREIGIMKAIGARNSHIALLFLIESGLLGLVGGIIGIGLGIGIGKAVEILALRALGTEILQVYFSPLLIIGALAFSFIVGCLSGTLPAIQASRMKPVDALRYE